MANADFNYIPINHHFTASDPSVTVNFPIEGSKPPVDDGYILINAHNVTQQLHKVLINDVELSGWDLPATSGGWHTFMDRIQPGLLKTGNNTLRIVAVLGDDFTVKDAVVHWRE